MTVADFLSVLEFDENVAIIDSEYDALFEGVSQNVPEEFNNCVIDSVFSGHDEDVLFIRVR